MNKIKEQEQKIIKKGFQVVDKNYEKPWGGYLVIDEDQAQRICK